MKWCGECPVSQEDPMHGVKAHVDEVQGAVVCGYTKKQFSDLLALTVKETPFYFNNKLFVQTDGVGMGSCLGPSLANAFLSFHECNWLNDCPPSFRHVYWRRYVNDTFFVI